MTDRDDTEFEPLHGSSQLHHVLTELQLYGYRPFSDEPDPRPLPEGKTIAAAVADVFDAVVATLSDHAKVAPFKRNDLMLTMMPIGVIVFPGTGIQDNLADKAKRLGIPVWKFGGA
jgi:hypothetical protein